jgi:hypothetical protein
MKVARSSPPDGKLGPSTFRKCRVQGVREATVRTCDIVHIGAVLCRVARVLAYSRNRGTRCTDPQSVSITRVTGNNIFACYKYK